MTIIDDPSSARLRAETTCFGAPNEKTGWRKRCPRVLKTPIFGHRSAHVVPSSELSCKKGCDHVVFGVGGVGSKDIEGVKSIISIWWRDFRLVNSWNLSKLVLYLFISFISFQIPMISYYTP
jgi:hypothetical protein